MGRGKIQIYAKTPLSNAEISHLISMEQKINSANDINCEGSQLEHYNRHFGPTHEDYGQRFIKIFTILVVCIWWKMHGMEWQLFD